MNNSNLCKICESSTGKIFRATILNKYKIQYFHCSKCGFVQTEEPYWLEEAYKNAINISDTGILKRNNMLSNITMSVILFYFNKKIRILDFAGGHGLFTRTMRDIGLDAYWFDKYAENIFSRGFEFSSDFKIDLVTAFEVFEHFVNPIIEIENILKISDNVLFSTTLLPKKIPEPSKWWYYGFGHGQHISFYSMKTLNFIAKKYSLNVYSNGKTIHFFTKKRFNLLIFKFLINSEKIGLFHFLKHFLNSKTISDHEILSKEIHE